jgi:heat shock protein HslJ
MLMVLLAACGGSGNASEGSDAPPPADPLRGHTFLSTAITVAGADYPLAAGTRVSLQFTDDGRLLASAGCNTLNGQIDVAQQKLSGELGMTAMGCAPELMAQDTWLAELLGAEPAWRLDGPELTVTSGQTELTLVEREVAEPDVALVETTWVVDTLIDGQTASSVPAGAQATLVFGVDRVTVAGGCNNGSTGYELSGSTIKFEGVTMTMKACAAPLMELEKAVIDVLTGAVAFEITADKLSLDHPSGKGLQLHAG